LNFLHSPVKNPSPLQHKRQANGHKAHAHKKARPDFSGAGCEVQGNLEKLEN
jgi:hypothetical protein